MSQSCQDFDFLIIDNNSNDGSREYIDKFSPAVFGKKNGTEFKIRAVFNKKNVGFAAGHNQGIRLTKSEYVLCLNQDVILDKNFLRNAIEILNSDDTIGSLQPKILRLKEINGNLRKTDIIDTTGLIMFKNRRIINRRQGEIDKTPNLPVLSCGKEGISKSQIPNKFNPALFEKRGGTKFKIPDEVFGADGAAPIYSRQALENVKIFNEYFDEDFFIYKEDVDLAWRLRLYGWKAVYALNVIAWHARGSGDSAKTKYWDIIQERRKISPFSKYYSFKNQRLMQIKNELPLLLLWHFLWWFPKEIVSWLYILIFERYTVKAIMELIRQMPLAWRKRKIIMENGRAGIKDMIKWFY